MRLTIVTANIGRNIGGRGVRRDMRSIATRLFRPMVGWQEIDEADPANEHGILARIFDKLGFKTVGFRSRVPITVPPGLNIVRRGTVHAAAGIPGASPRRVITEVLVKNKVGRGVRFVHLNVHYPAGAFNRKQEHNQRAREDRWNDTFEKHQERVKYWVDKGCTVFWTGDVNRQRMPKVHPKERRLVTSGIDSISVIEGNADVKVLKRGRLRLRSDHDAQWVRVKITKNKNKNC